MSLISRGRLDVVATPIGNLEDLTPRARAALGEADLIVAEDTRRTGRLLESIGVKRPLVSMHAHNEADRVPGLIERLRGGARIALVSDAGTPLLSDPGFALVRAAVSAGIAVHAVPGASAITAALSVAGLPSERFAFEGFLPAKESERRTRVAALAREPRTLVFFEAPHRIAQSLADLALALGETREAAVARELTKVFETVYRGSLGDLARLAGRDANLARGELTIIVQGAAENAAASAAPPDLERVVGALLEELPPSRAARLAARLTGADRAAAYELAMRLPRRRRSPETR
jgi:16S rRNA (cytidine1402-2'-O)-methyltransferase